MKKSVILFVLVFATMGTLFTSCSEAKPVKIDEAKVAEVEHYCPMKCEDDKTYAEPGKCPVCKMDLVVKE